MLSQPNSASDAIVSTRRQAASPPFRKTGSATNAVIKTTGLSYHYARGVQTLFDLNLEVERGCVYGFLGPNGSGKTTTLSLLLGLLNNQQGTIEIFGKSVASHRTDILKKIGSLVEAPSLYGHLTATENLDIYREMYGVSKDRIAEVLRIVGLHEAGRKKAKRFSLGMKQRLAIALALLPDPELLILDEPSNGLDPAGIIELRQLINKLNKEHGMTILISSHLLAEVEKMVTHLGIIYKGKMLFQGPLSELHRFQERGSQLVLNTSDNEAALALLANHQPQLDADGITCAYHDQEQAAAIAETLLANGIRLYALQPKVAGLEQLFIQLTSDAS